MKVLQEGNPSNRCRCMKCDSLLQYEPLDVRQPAICDGRGSWYRYVKCPVCGAEVILEVHMNGLLFN